MVTISVVVPATNAPPTLDACLAAIRATAQGPDEVVVVSDPELRGPAAARNAGARTASGDVLVFVDADVRVHADAIVRIRDAFTADPGLTALFGSYDDRPEAPGVVSRFRNLMHHHVHQSSAGPATTFWGGIGAIRREAFESVQGFDADRFLVPSVEDIELGMRLSDAGARIELRPEIQGTHLKAWSLGQMLYTDFTRRGVPWVRLLLERGGSSRALNLGWRHRLSTASVVLGAAALAARRTRLAAAAGASLVALNRPFYALLFRRRGATEGLAGIGLHALHHLAAAASLPVGLLLHKLSPRRRPPSGD